MKNLLISIMALLCCGMLSAQSTEPIVHEFDPKTQDGTPFRWSVAVPEGNWTVSVVIGSKKHPASTVVRAESSRLMVEETETAKGKFETVTFTVNRRDPEYPGNYVRLKADVAEKLNWDDSLNLEFTGAAPYVQSVTIAPAEDAVTVFLFGDSTVCDYDGEPYASWGQMITAFFGPSVAFANYAETGETTNSCISSKRFEKGLSRMKAGDYVFLEFGHNDEKQTRPGSGAWYYYSTNLKIMIDQIEKKGAHPVLVTPTQRRRWKAGRINDTHGEFPAAMKAVAERESLPVIDLTAMTTAMYEAMGEKASEALLTYLPAGALEGLDKDLKDNTHFCPFGAYEVAKCVIQGICDEVPALSSHLLPGWSGFDPAYPDVAETFKWNERPFTTYKKPRGN